MEDDSKIKSGIQIVQRSAMSKCKRGFSALRDEGHLMDVQIKVGDTTFDCHKVVLCAYSEYFKAMFTTARMKETKQKIIELQLLEPEYVKIAIDFIYSDQLILSLANFCGVMTTAVYLQIDTLIQRFVQDIRRLVDVNSLMSIWAFTENYPTMCSTVNTLCLNFAIANFEKVTDCSDFIEHPDGHILFTKVLGDKTLEVKSEEIVVFAVINWIMFDPLSRKKYLADILEYVHLPLLEKNVLNTVKDIFPLIKEQPFCSFLEEAERYHADPARQLDYTSVHTQLRRKSRDRCRTIFGLLGIHFEDLDGDNEFSYVLSVFDGQRSWLATDHLDLPFGFQPGCLAAICSYGGSEVYIADGENTCKFYCYRSNGSQSEELSEHQRRRSDHCLVAIKENLYLLGGTYFTKIPEETHNDAERSFVAESDQEVRLFEPLVEVFNVPSKQWESSSNMQVSVPVEKSVAAVQDDLIYLLGTRLNSPPYNSGGDDRTLVQVINPRDESCKVLYCLEIDPPLSAVKFDAEIILCTRNSVLKFCPCLQPDSRVEEISTIDMTDFVVRRPSSIVRRGEDLILIGDALNSEGVSVRSQWKKFDMSTKTLRNIDAENLDMPGPYHVSVMEAQICPIIINWDLILVYQYLSTE